MHWAGARAVPRSWASQARVPSPALYLGPGQQRQYSILTLNYTTPYLNNELTIQWPSKAHASLFVQASASLSSSPRALRFLVLASLVTSLGFIKIITTVKKLVRTEEERQKKN